MKEQLANTLQNGHFLNEQRSEMSCGTRALSYSSASAREGSTERTDAAASWDIRGAALTLVAPLPTKRVPHGRGCKNILRIYEQLASFCGSFGCRKI